MYKCVAGQTITPFLSNINNHTSHALATPSSRSLCKTDHASQTHGIANDSNCPMTNDSVVIRLFNKRCKATILHNKPHLWMFSWLRCDVRGSLYNATSGNDRLIHQNTPQKWCTMHISTPIVWAFASNTTQTAQRKNTDYGDQTQKHKIAPLQRVRRGMSDTIPWWWWHFSSYGDLVTNDWRNYWLWIGGVSTEIIKAWPIKYDEKCTSPCGSNDDTCTGGLCTILHCDPRHMC